jgi:hypothetical protein
MEQMFGQLSVIRDQQEAGGGIVEPPNREHPFSHPAQKISHGRATFRVSKRAHHTDGFVQDEIVKLWRRF